MFRAIIGGALLIFLFLTIGSILLETFPSVQPMWEEAKELASTLYNTSLGKYGMVGTILLIGGIVVLVGTNKGSK